MNVEISYTGTLKILVENTVELYAVKKWIEDSVAYSDKEDIIEINMGSFDIQDNFIDVEECGISNESLLDHVVEMKS